MAYGVDIDKIKESDGIYYYYVKELGENPSKFYIGIDPQKNCIYYYYTHDFSKPIGTYDFNNLNERLPQIEGHRRATNIAMAQAYYAIKKNEFPLYIGRYS